MLLHNSKFCLKWNQNSLLCRYGQLQGPMGSQRQDQYPEICLSSIPSLEKKGNILHCCLYRPAVRGVGREKSLYALFPHLAHPKAGSCPWQSLAILWVSYGFCDLLFLFLYCAASAVEQNKGRTSKRLSHLDSATNQDGWAIGKVEPFNLESQWYKRGRLLARCSLGSFWFCNSIFLVSEDTVSIVL